MDEKQLRQEKLAKRGYNLPVSEGDKIVAVHINSMELEIPSGTQGTVLRNDTIDGINIIAVRWDKGFQTNIIPEEDLYKMAGVIKESSDHKLNFFRNNQEIFENFDWRFLRKYLLLVRDSGIVNMFGAGFTLYCGKDHLERYYGEDREDDEDFQKVLDMAEEAKRKMIQGTVQVMEKENREVNVNSVNTAISRFASQITNMYAVFPTPRD